jgi:hypothetical protein
VSWWSRFSRPNASGSAEPGSGPATSSDDSDELGEPVDQAIADGLMIAKFAVVMGAKNRIIVRALRNDKPFDREVAAQFVREQLRLIADEQRRNDERVIEVRRTASQKRKAARHQHDYGRDDVDALKRRELVYTAVADELDRVRANDALVAELAEQARDSAWQDVAVEVESRLERLAQERVLDDDYESEREDRMRLIREVDLFMLRTAQSRHER